MWAGNEYAHAMIPLTDYYLYTDLGDAVEPISVVTDSDGSSSSDPTAEVDDSGATKGQASIAARGGFVAKVAIGLLLSIVIAML